MGSLYTIWIACGTADDIFLDVAPRGCGRFNKHILENKLVKLRPEREEAIPDFCMLHSIATFTAKALLHKVGSKISVENQ